MGIWEQVRRPIEYILSDLQPVRPRMQDPIGHMERFTSDRNLKYTDRRGEIHHFPVDGEITTEADGIHVTLLIDSFRWDVDGHWLESDNVSINLVSAQALGRFPYNRLLEVAAVIPAAEFPEFNGIKWTLMFGQTSMQMRRDFGEINRTITSDRGLFKIEKGRVPFIFGAGRIRVNISNRSAIASVEFAPAEVQFWRLNGAEVIYCPSGWNILCRSWDIGANDGNWPMVLTIDALNSRIFAIPSGNLSPIDGRPLTSAAEFIEFETRGENGLFRPNARDGLREPMPPRFANEGYELSPYGRPWMLDQAQVRSNFGDHFPHWLYDAVMPFDTGSLKDSRKIPEIEKQCQECRNYHGQTWGGNRLVCGMHPMGNESQCSDFEPKPDELARH